MVTVSACGPLAVHPSVDDGAGESWTVTHIGTGMAFTRVSSREDAIRVAEVLLSTARVTETDDAQELVLGLLLWVRPWIQRVSAKRAWVDPSSFQNKRRVRRG